MILPDVNVLLYAHRADTPDHARYRDWLRSVLEGDEPLVLPDVVTSAVVRVATDRRVFRPPSTLDEAFAFVTDVRSHPKALPARPGPATFEIFERLCRDGGVRGFARFPGLRWRHPLDD
jgi:toxin-antitoxin system PIN domain toxin